MKAMHKNPLWLTFLGVIILIVCWYAAVAFYQLYHYYTLRSSTKATVQTWSAKEVASEEFAPYADYTFTVNQKKFEGHAPLKYPIFRNMWAVDNELPKLASKEWIVWYNPSNPQDSTLQKKFPTKECVSAALLFCLLLYFIWLGFYVAKKQQ